VVFLLKFRVLLF